MNYSQNNEQQVILDYFKGQTGIFLSIGENDGTTFSNVRALAELGWGGVCVEPSPTAFLKLKELYQKTPRVFTYNFALGITNDNVKMWDSGSHIGNDHGLLSTLVEDEKERWPGQKYEEITVKCFRWKTFLNRLKYKSFDMLSIDVEGMEIPILEQMDLSQFKLACVEWNGKNKEKYDLLFRGFKVIYTSGENLIYAV